MSFGEKIAAIMERPGQDPANKDDVAWWMKYAGRGVGTVGGFLAIFLGAANCVSIIFGDVSCLVSGMWQMVAGFIVIVVEAPCCCMFLDFVQSVSDTIDRRPYWNRAVAYILLSLPAIIVCRTFSSIFGSGLLLATGVIYGLMSFGKTASIDNTSAVAGNPPAPTATMQANLVDNAQPMGFTSKPDSNV